MRGSEKVNVTPFSRSKDTKAINASHFEWRRRVLTWTR